MSHFINKATQGHCTRQFSNPRAAVRVEVAKEQGKTVLKLVAAGIEFIAAGTELISLPKGISVISDSGEEILASGMFFATGATIDPYHLLTDVF